MQRNLSDRFLTCQSSHKAGASCILVIIHRAIFVIICDLFLVKRNNQHPSHRPAYNLSASRYASEKLQNPENAQAHEGEFSYF